MEVAISVLYSDFLQVGKSVRLTNLEQNENVYRKINTCKWESRSSFSNDQSVYRGATSRFTRRNLFRSNYGCKVRKQCDRNPRKLLVDNRSVYLIKNDSILTLTEINPVYFGAEKVIIKGLSNNTKILSQTLPGAFDGMIVKINKKK